VKTTYFTLFRLALKRTNDRSYKNCKNEEDLTFYRIINEF